jgi:hypothetical protein
MPLQRAGEDRRIGMAVNAVSLLDAVTAVPVSVPAHIKGQVSRVNCGCLEM